MIIAIASGKGGTGKTTISASLAKASSGPITLLDCDVEEPNAALFFGNEPVSTEDFHVDVPLINTDSCTGCGKCRDICRFNAIVIIKGKASVFPELCHSCGGCTLVCPEKAITEEPSKTGEITVSVHGNVRLMSGLLDIGKAMSPPLIRELKRMASDAETVIIDSPPGTSCPMVTSVEDADYIVLVTEPTPFGLNDLKLAVETVRKLCTPFGVVINRSDSGDESVREYCASEIIPLLLEVPEDRAVAEAYSRGIILSDVNSKYRVMIEGLLKSIRREVQEAAR